ncbi:SUN domain-containing protein 3-like, partial [Meleagris gallopavo]|uniref:SUN domain-containing protein 3-like n=1 Tax=Meleagris gallopavo TaxID=9103 RepID=UPI0012AB509E
GGRRWEGCPAGSGQAEKGGWLTPELLSRPLRIPLLSLDCCSITRRTAPTGKASSVLPAQRPALGLFASPLTDASFSFQPDISPGNCWAFSGSRGHVVIRLPEEIQLAALTIWHISEAFSPSGEVSSALREFAVSGVDEASGETLLGLFVYNVDGEIAQTFHLQIWREEPRKAFGRVKLEVWSNWGSAEHTRVYRVEIHSNS